MVSPHESHADRSVLIHIFVHLTPLCRLLTVQNEFQCVFIVDGLENPADRSVLLLRQACTCSNVSLSCAQALVDYARSFLAIMSTFASSRRLGCLPKLELLLAQRAGLCYNFRMVVSRKHLFIARRLKKARVRNCANRISWDVALKWK
jgi:hypothetical protein